MSSWYTSYIPSWANRWWNPPRPVNPYQSTRPAPECKSLYNIFSTFLLKFYFVFYIITMCTEFIYLN